MTHKTNRYRLGVLVSGNGTNLQAIIDAINAYTLPKAEISIVISNKKSAYALERAKKDGINTKYLNPKDFKTNEEYDKQIVTILKSYDVDMVILAGYTKILTYPLLNNFKNRILNIHPSLLPSFGGLNMYGINVHKAVKNSGIKQSGCTVHIVTKEVDKGPILSQAKVNIMDNDTPETIAQKVLIEEHKLLPATIKSYLNQIYGD